jgi:hypothetical protein
MYKCKISHSYSYDIVFFDVDPYNIRVCDNFTNYIQLIYHGSLRPSAYIFKATELVSTILLQ